MGKGETSSNESTSTTSNTTQNEDNRVGAEGEGIAIGKEAQINIDQQFSPDVAAQFKNLIDFAGEVGAAALQVHKDAMANAERTLNAISDQSSKALEAVSTRLENQEQPAKSLFSNLLPYLIVVAVAIMIVVALINLTKKK
ncbi:MAG: hypothetical protein PHP10_03610 [Candidatus Omnitrophica bacterium]|nr:hypothetical protein [Candidatus Omnitrophota bacterium]